MEVLGMAFRVAHLNKKTGTTYVYESVSFWDKEKKQSRNKQICIGKLDPETGELLPSKRRTPRSDQDSLTPPVVHSEPHTVTASIVGPSIILDSLAEQLGIVKLLRKAFPDSYASILSMVYYLVCQGGALCQCESWTRTHRHPSRESLSSQRISEILASITTNSKQTFLSSWIGKILDDEFL